MIRGTLSTSVERWIAERFCKAVHDMKFPECEEDLYQNIRLIYQKMITLSAWERKKARE
jgi:hypothetical protein